MESVSPRFKSTAIVVCRSRLELNLGTGDGKQLAVVPRHDTNLLAIVDDRIQFHGMDAPILAGRTEML